MPPHLGRDTLYLEVHSGKFLPFSEKGFLEGKEYSLSLERVIPSNDFTNLRVGLDFTPLETRIE